MATQTHPTPEGVDDLAQYRELIAVGDGERDELPVEAPFTGETIGTIPQCVPGDVEAAAETARSAGERWAARHVEDRAAAMVALHDAVLDRREAIIDLMQLESGKSRRDAYEEILDVAVTARHYAHRAGDYLSTEKRKAALLFLTTTRVHHHPKGVVGIIAPWNYPLVMALSDAIPALLAGNAVVIKPAEQTPYTALLAKELLVEAGVPPGCFQVLTGRGEPLGEPLVAASDYVNFTGSTAVGRKVGAWAGEHLIDCSLELGGKNPMIVLPDADVEAAASAATRGCFSNAGQLCLSLERIYAHEDVYDEFLSAFVAATEALEFGAEYDYGIEVASLLSADQLERIEAHVADARERGATVETGGKHRPDVGPYCYEPTILTDLPADATAACEETFGPVVAVTPVGTPAAAIERANDSPYGLNASIWTEAGRGHDLATEIECGTVNVNETFVATWGSVDAPMGGMKDSGIGRRHGREGFFKYTEPQAVASHSGPPLAAPIGSMDYERFTDLMSRFLKVGKYVPGLR